MTALLCPMPACRIAYEVSDEDPDSTLTDIHNHLTGHHWLDGDDALAWLARVTETADDDTVEAHRP